MPNLTSKYFTIIYPDDVNIEWVNRRIRFDGDDVLKKLDNMLMETMRLLGMYPRRKIHLTVKIYKNQRQIDKSVSIESYKSQPIFYIHRQTTIHALERAVSAGRLLHEIGHAVARHYFVMPIPAKIAGMIPQYVEASLGGRRSSLRRWRQRWKF